MGTVWYMSPEQVRGQMQTIAPISSVSEDDPLRNAWRSTSFSREHAETMTAILKEDPPRTQGNRYQLQSRSGERITPAMPGEKIGNRDSIPHSKYLHFALEALSTVSGSGLQTRTATPVRPETGVGLNSITSNLRGLSRGCFIDWIVGCIAICNWPFPPNLH